MWTVIKTSLSQMSGGTLAAGVASVGAVGLISYGAWHNTRPAALAPMAALQAPVNATIITTVKPGAEPAPAVAPPSPVVVAPEVKTPSAAPVDDAKASVAFDIARVEPDGSALVAGRATPNSTVELRDDGKVIGTVSSGPTGQFVILPMGLKPGPHLLTLGTKTADGNQANSPQSITVVVPQNKTEEVIVALTAPGEATKILSDAKPAPKPTAEPAKTAPAALDQRVTIRTVEAGEGGALFATGSAPAGAAIQLYLSGTAIAKATAAPDGHWSLKVGKGMRPGGYQVRADALNAKGEVTSRAEVPFDYPAEALSAAPVTAAVAPQSVTPPVEASKTPPVKSEPVKTPAPDTQATQTKPAETPAPSSADAVVAKLDTAQVSRGDSLWRISRKVYGHGVRYTQIYEANTKQIRDPKLIYPGQVLVLPSDKALPVDKAL